MCPGANFGTGILAANPVPHTETVNALRVHFRNWVMKDIAAAGEQVSDAGGRLPRGSDEGRRSDSRRFPACPRMRRTG